MVLLTVTPAAKAALDDYDRLNEDGASDATSEKERKSFIKTEIGSPIEHHDLITVARVLRKQESGDTGSETWRLDVLLKGASVYNPPPPPKPEPTPQFKALMQRLRQQEEQRQYERMTNPQPTSETFSQRFPNAARTFNPNISHGQTGVDDTVDETTYQDVERQMALIINVLVSIICCAVAIWIAARHWSVPQRLGLSMSGSITVAVAEVVIYMGYIRRVKEAKTTEAKIVETKEIGETWVIEKQAVDEKKAPEDGVRHRRGRHR